MVQKILPKRIEEAYQFSVRWVDTAIFTGAGLSHMQVLLTPSSMKDQVSSFNDVLTDLHPMYQELAKEQEEVFLVSYVLKDPCPAPPDFGVDIQAKLRKFEIFIREEDLDFICAFMLELQERSQIIIILFLSKTR